VRPFPAGCASLPFSLIKKKRSPIPCLLSLSLSPSLCFTLFYTFLSPLLSIFRSLARTSLVDSELNVASVPYPRFVNSITIRGERERVRERERERERYPRSFPAIVVSPLPPVERIDRTTRVVRRRKKKKKKETERGYRWGTRLRNAGEGGGVAFLVCAIAVSR